MNRRSTVTLPTFSSRHRNHRHAGRAAEVTGNGADAADTPSTGNAWLSAPLILTSIFVIQLAMNPVELPAASVAASRRFSAPTSIGRDSCPDDQSLSRCCCGMSGRRSPVSPVAFSAIFRPIQDRYRRSSRSASSSKTSSNSSHAVPTEAVQPFHAGPQAPQVSLHVKMLATTMPSSGPAKAGMSTP